jgi:hypothetical protein
LIAGKRRNVKRRATAFLYSICFHRLTAAVGELHDMGLPDPVLNYMQQTYIEAERRQQSAEDWGEQMWGPYSYW